MYLKIFLISFSLFFIACNNSGDSVDKGIISEKEGLSRSVSTRETLILNLEAVYPHKNDTSVIGVDTYKVSVDEAHSREYCLENDLGAGHRYTIEDSKGKLLLDITHGCATINLLSGVYTHKIYNGTAGEGKSHTVFITPKIPKGSLLGVSNSVIKKSRGATRAFDTVFKKRSVISFDRCRGCNLENINLSKSAFDSQYAGNDLAPRMNEEYFTKLGTTKTEFFSTQNRDIDTYNVRRLDLQEASLISANLSLSIFRNANFDAVNFTDANLSSAVFINCSFRGAIFNNVDMTRAVFIKPVFDKNSSLKPTIVSKPAITSLFKNGKDTFYFDLVAAINSKNQLVLVTGPKTTVFLRNLPRLVQIVSPPTIVPNNFNGGYSVFVKGNDGYIYEWYNPFNQKKITHGHATGWKKINGSNVCKSNPDASYINFGGSEKSNALSVTVACHNNQGVLYTWTRTFYNKYNKSGDSKYGNWAQKKYNIEKTKQEISINAHGTYFYQLGGRYFFGRNYKTGKLLHRFKTYSNFASRVDFDPVSVAFGSFIDDSGDIYALKMYENSNTRIYLGSPATGLISSPATGSKRLSGHRWIRNTVVLGSEGRIYENNGNLQWTPIGASFDGQFSAFAFTNNNLTEAYIEDADLSGLDLSSNNLTKTFFTNTTFKNTKFNDMSLNETVFDASFKFSGIEFKNSTLKNIAFTNNKMMRNTDFKGSTMDGLTLTKNRLECMKFDNVTFASEGVINSSDNSFISSGGCSPMSFINATNVPVEIVFQQPKESMASQPAHYLAQHDFSSASFSDTFYGLDFKNQDMSGAKFGALDLISPSVDFRAIDATGSSWANANLSFVKCDGCTFDNTILTNTNLYQAKLNNSTFVKSVWTNVNATYAQFQSSNLDAISISKSSDISHTSFNNSSLLQSNLSGLNLNGSSFDGSKVACSNLSGVNFSGSSFVQALLNGTDFSNPVSNVITNASFRGANLSGVNFENVSFTNSVLSDATFDFSGAKITIDKNRGCSAKIKKPSTNSTTTCPDGNKPSTKCSL